MKTTPNKKTKANYKAMEAAAKKSREALDAFMAAPSDESWAAYGEAHDEFQKATNKFMPKR